jgi:hypothetical protein
MNTDKPIIGKNCFGGARLLMSRMWSAVTCHRFPKRRHVGAVQELCKSLHLCASALKKVWLKNFDVTILKRDKRSVVYADNDMACGVFVI